MKLIPILLSAVTCVPCAATVLQLGTIEQAVNLGRFSDPTRIPLGPVLVESNHGYGVHEVITEPRASTHGALVLEKGLELNMNLASVFGILVEPQDSTQVPQLPVVIRLRDWPVPAYSPYTKEQVLAATIHCLLRSVHATRRLPLTIKIDAENPEDARNLAAFAGDYVTAETEEPNPVPGTHLETDAHGVTYVVLDDRERTSRAIPQRAPPVLVPMRIDDGSDEVFYELIPVWSGDNWERPPQEVLGIPVPLFYDRFDPSQGHGSDVNALTNLGGLGHPQWVEEVDRVQFAFSLSPVEGRVPEHLVETVAATCHALVAGEQPTAERPLRIRVLIAEALREEFEGFADSAGWTLEPAPKGTDHILSCSFVWDPKARSLKAGSIPRGALAREAHRPWSVTFSADGD